MAKYPHEMSVKERFEQIAARKLAKVPCEATRTFLAGLVAELLASHPEPADEKGFLEFANTLREVADYVEHGRIPPEHYPTGRIED